MPLPPNTVAGVYATQEPEDPDDLPLVAVEEYHRLGIRKGIKTRAPAGDMDSKSPIQHSKAQRGDPTAASFAFMKSILTESAPARFAWKSVSPLVMTYRFLFSMFVFWVPTIFLWTALLGGLAAFVFVAFNPKVMAHVILSIGKAIPRLFLWMGAHISEELLDQLGFKRPPAYPTSYNGPFSGQ